MERLFDGPEYRPTFDKKRLTNQMENIIRLMKDNKWRTLSMIKRKTGASETSISAQLRHLRKDKWGNQIIDKRRAGDKTKGLFEYRLTLIHPNKLPEKIFKSLNK